MDLIGVWRTTCITWYMTPRKKSKVNALTPNIPASGFVYLKTLIYLACDFLRDVIYQVIRVVSFSDKVYTPDKLCVHLLFLFLFYTNINLYKTLQGPTCYTIFTARHLDLISSLLAEVIEPI